MNIIGQLLTPREKLEVKEIIAFLKSKGYEIEAYNMIGMKFKFPPESIKEWYEKGA